MNWASERFDPAQYFDWATPEYKRTGYAELLDIYMTGLYYTLVTKAEVDEANEAGRPAHRSRHDRRTELLVLHRGRREWAKKIPPEQCP